MREGSGLHADWTRVLNGSQPDGGDKGRLRRTLRAGASRIGISLSVTGLAALGSFFLSVSIARMSDVEGVGRYALAMSVGLFVVGLASQSLTVPMVALQPSDKQVAAVAGWVIRLGVVSIPIVCLVAWGFQSIEMILVGISVPAMVIVDHYRYTYNAIRGSWKALLLEVPRSSVAFACMVLSLFGIGSGVLYLSLWLAASWLTALPLTVKMLSERGAQSSAPVIPPSVSRILGFEYVIGSGGHQLTTLLIGAVAGVQVNAALRGGATLLGPISMATSAIGSLLVAYFARRKDRVTIHALTIGGIGAVASGLGVLLMLLVPDEAGRAILGETWDVARPVLAWLGLDLLLSAFGTPADAIMRSRWAGKNLMIARLVGTPIRFLLVIPAAMYGGAVLAAAAMAIAAAIRATICWILMLRDERTPRSAT